MIPSGTRGCALFLVRMLTRPCLLPSRFRRIAHNALLLWCLSGGIPALVLQAQAPDPVHVAPQKQIPGKLTSNEQGRDAAPSLHARSKPFRADVDVVQVVVTVVDSNNHPVTGLQREDFIVFEDEKEQKIQFLSAEDAPISVGLLLDLSNSMTTKFDFEREAVREFFQNSDPNDDFFAIGFSDRPQILADSTQSIGDIQAKLLTATPHGYTALLDSIYLGASKLNSARYPRRALLIISDGGDNTSRYSFKETKKMVEEADVAIYAIALNDGLPVFRTLEERWGQRLLTQITEISGGRTVKVENAAYIPQAAAAISWELRNQYVLAYRSTNQARDGNWRKLKVRIRSSNKTGLHLYYKRGYTAPTG